MEAEEGPESQVVVLPNVGDTDQEGRKWCLHHVLGPSVMGYLGESEKLGCKEVASALATKWVADLGHDGGEQECDVIRHASDRFLR